MLHKDILKLLFSFELGGEFEKDIEIEGKHLDAAQVRAEDILKEIFSDTAVDLLSAWERVYALYQSELPLYQRIQNLLTAVRKKNRLDIKYLQSIVYPFVGYDVEITDYMIFRCDDPRCLTDSDVYAFDNDLIWQFTIKIDNALVQTPGYNPALVQTAIDDAKPAHTRGVLDTGTYGFFCDDTNSVTDLTLLAL